MSVRPEHTADEQGEVGRGAAYRGLLTMGSGQVARQLLAFCRNVIIVRQLTKADFGIAATFALTVALLEMLSNLSTNQLLVQSRDGDRRGFQGSVQLFGFIRGVANGLLIFLLAAPVARLFDVPEAMWAFRVLAAIPVLRGLVHLDLVRATRHMRFGRFVAVQIVSEVILVACAWPIAALTRDYSAVLWLLVGREFMLTLGSHLFATRRYEWAFERESLRNVFAFGWPLALNGLVLFGVQQGDRLVIGSSSQLFEGSKFTIDDLGVYSVAATLCMILAMMAANTSGSVFLPALSRCQDDRSRFLAKFALGVDLYAVLGGGLAILFVLNGTWLVPFIYGVEYVRAGEIACVLGTMYGFGLIRAAVICAAMSRGETRTSLIANIFRVSGLVGMILVAATGGGLVGVAAAGLGGELIALSVAILRLGRIHRIHLRLTLLPTSIVVGAISISAGLRMGIDAVWGASMALPITVVVLALFVISMYRLRVAIRREVDQILRGPRLRGEATKQGARSATQVLEETIRIDSGGAAGGAAGVAPPTPPTVSIGLPVYNGENYLREALDALLKQTFTDFEVVICDNASTDRTAEICSEFAAADPRVRYYRNKKNLGALANYNRTVDLATGKYFKWSAHDDICAPTFLEKCVDVLDASPDVVMSFPSISYIDADGGYLRTSEDRLSIRDESIRDRVQRLLRLEIRGLDIFWSVFGLMRMDALKNTDRLADYVASDQTLLLQLILQGGFQEVPERLFFRREHAGTSTNLKSYRSRAAWYSGAGRGGVVLPNCRLIKEHLAIIGASGMLLLDRLACQRTVATRFVRRWRFLLREFVSIPEQLVGKHE